MKSDRAKAVLAAVAEPVRAFFRAVDLLDFEATKESVRVAEDFLKQQQEACPVDDDEALNELAVIRFFIRFLSEYALFWERVSKREFEPSWMALQDILDSIRLLKRVSSLDVSRFENQFGRMEQVYPYKMFASVGFIAGRIECSICEKDIDSFECDHRRGQLYSGKMACGIVREIRQLDHVALTENPRDKRCVMKLQGTAYQFPAIEWLAKHLNDRNFVVSDISHVELSERRKRDESIASQGRNDPCQCGSGKKFKRCCAEKAYITYPHGEFILLRPPREFRADLGREVS